MSNALEQALLDRDPQKLERDTKVRVKAPTAGNAQERTELARVEAGKLPPAPPRPYANPYLEPPKPAYQALGESGIKDPELLQILLNNYWADWFKRRNAK